MLCSFLDYHSLVSCTRYHKQQYKLERRTRLNYQPRAAMADWELSLRSPLGPHIPWYHSSLPRSTSASERSHFRTCLSFTPDHISPWKFHDILHMIPEFCASKQTNERTTHKHATEKIHFYPRDGMQKRGNCYRKVSVRLSVRHTEAKVLKRIPFPRKNGWTYRVPKFDRLTHLDRSINTHRPSSPHPKGARPPPPKIFHTRSVYIPTVRPSSTVVIRLIDNNQPSSNIARVCQRYMGSLLSLCWLRTVTRL